MYKRQDGFEVIFTEPIKEKSGADIASYKMDAYTYIFQSGYGSPVVDKSNPTIKSASVSQDKKSVYLKIEGLVKGNVHELNLPGVKSIEGKALLHQVGYYTLNEIPKN